MKVGTIAFLQNMLTLQTLILYKLQHVRGTGTFSCLQQSHFTKSLTRVTFLGEEDAGLLLYTTLWSKDMRLLTCDIQSNPLAIANYSALCNTSNEDVRLTQMIHALMSPNSPCAKIDAPHGVQSATKREAKLRRKRSWIFPGTLWCGTGSKAFGFNELGMFERADRCCREHDLCLHIIPAFTVNYGVFNPNFYTVSHCDCDERFRQCLLNVNDTISSMVLYSFFKILKVPCFELQLQKRCTELYWWGMCKVTQEAPYAVFKKPTYYNISFTSASEKSDASESTASKLHQFNENQEIKSTKRKLRPVEKCISKDPPRGDTFFHMKTNGCRKKKKNQATVAQDLHTTPLKTDISNKTKGLQSLSGHGAALNTAAPYVKATFTTSTTARSSKRPNAATTSTTNRRAKGRQLSAEKTLQSQNQNSRLTTTLPAGTPTGDLASTRTPFVRYYDTTTTADPFNHYFERKTQRQGDTSYPEQEVNDLTISEEMDDKQNKSLINNKTDVCERLKKLKKCKYKIPPKKKRFGLKNWDTKPAYHCDCTKRLALEIESLKQLSVHSFLVHSVSENCFKLPKRNKCQHKKSCSGVFSKASDLLQALKKIEQNDIAGVRNSAKLRKGRIFVQLYKRCLRLRKDVMAPLT